MSNGKLLARAPSPFVNAILRVDPKATDALIYRNFTYVIYKQHAERYRTTEKTRQAILRYNLTGVDPVGEHITLEPVRVRRAR